MWRSENCNNNKPVCKMEYEYICLPKNLSLFYILHLIVESQFENT
jgi:hypothetical protein